MEIITLIACLSPAFDYTTIRQLSTVAEAILAMSGRVTMQGISRWTDDYGSYRTVQRLFYSKIDWLKLRWLFVKKHLIDKDDVILIAGDEVVVSKSGKQTYGLGYFYSSLCSKAIPSISFLCISLISVANHSSYPLVMKQIIKEKSPAKEKQEQSSKKGKKGRPKGSCNKNRTEVELSPYLQFVKAAINSLLSVVGSDISLVYFVFDGAFGNNDALQMVRQCDLHLISKLRYDSALYLPYCGEYCGRGRRKKYGNKLDYKNIPVQYLKSYDFDGHIQTKIYQLNVWHKLFPQLLNVVIMVKTNLQNGKTGHVILFSSDLELSYDKLIEYYKLRFQIEFNFRDAKQYWGLEDFMNISKNAVHNAANLAMFMVNLSFVLLQQNPIFGASINDLKSWFRARKYVLDTLKLVDQNADPISIEGIIHDVSKRGKINPSVYQI